jgi:hypothetical protein
MANVTTNLGSPTLYLGSGTTVSNASAGNEPVTLDQLRSAVVGNVNLYFSTDKQLGFTNSITPTNATYNLKFGTVPEQGMRTNSSSGIGTYVEVDVFTNRTYTVFAAQSISVQAFLCENGPGSMYAKMEIYRYEPITSNLYEWGEAAASNLVAAGSTPVLSPWSIPVSSIATNIPFYIASRIKHVAGSQTNLIIGVGSNYPSLVSFTVPASVFTEGYEKLDGSTGPHTGNEDMGGNLLTNAQFEARGIPYTVPFATSNDISTAYSLQYYAPTNTTTIYLPAANTNYSYSIRLEVNPGTNSFSIYTNSGVLFTTNDVLGVGSGEVRIPTTMSSVLLLDKPKYNNKWRVWGLQ